MAEEVFSMLACWVIGIVTGVTVYSTYLYSTDGYAIKPRRKR
jgi:hypothetical protein